jgi:serine/threonine protein kinase
MEYVEGETIRDRLGRGPLPVDAVVALGAMLLEALHHAHLAGLLHRDIKPENVMLTPADTPKLLDFGLARAIGPDALTGTNLTLGGIAGTVGYMSPEQLHGEELDVRSDLFSMGAVLYELLVGRAAFPGTTMAERIGAILSREPDPLPVMESRLAFQGSCSAPWPAIGQVGIPPRRPSSRTGAGCPTGPPCNPGSRRRWPSWTCATSRATRATSGSAAASPRASRRIWPGCPA